MKKLFYLLLLFLNSQSISVFAQCGTANNIIQSLTDNYTVGVNPIAQVGQSFTATCTGNIESITLSLNLVNADGDHKMRIYAGIDASNPIDSTILTLISAQSNTDVKITFPLPVPVISGNVYTFMMQAQAPASARYIMNSFSVYSGGLSYTNLIGSLNFNPTGAADGDFKFIIHYQDQIAPIAVCQNITAELDQTGNVVFSPSLVGSGSSDDSGIFSLSMDTSYSCSDLGANTVILTVNDSSGNSATCNAIITVVDSLAPEIICPGDKDTTLIVGENYILSDYISTGMVSMSDNCSSTLLNITQSPVAGTLLSPGVNTISISAEDESGNQGTCSFEILVGTSSLVDLELSGIEIYPNPAADWLSIKNSNCLILEQASIYDLSGKLISRTQLNETISEQKLDLTQINSGSYFVVIKSVDGQFIQQLIKKD
jgi:hypothetical protein